MSDGRALVTVHLHTRDALAWAIPGCVDYDTAPTIFGERLGDVLDGAAPAFADSYLKLEFTIAAPGDPLPDLLAILFGFEAPEVQVQNVLFQADGDGLLADGTPGKLTIRERGLFDVGGIFNNPDGAAADAFPADVVTVRAVGN